MAREDCWDRASHYAASPSQGDDYAKPRLLCLSVGETEKELAEVERTTGAGPGEMVKGPS